MHVLLAHDGTPGARRAARFLERLAPLIASRVTVLGVSPPRQPWRLRDWATTGAEEPGAAFRTAGLPTEVAVVEGGTVSALVDRVLADGVDLVVLGGRGGDVLSRLLGSTAREVLRRSPVPTLVVGRAPLSVERMLVCTGLEVPHGTVALGPAVAIAAATGAEVEVLHVMSQVAGGSDDAARLALRRGASWHRDNRTPEGRCLDAVVEAFAARGVTARPRLRHGLVVDEIVEEARTRSADLVVLGAHDRPGLLPRLLENITEQVVGELRRPVLVVREPPER